MKTGGRATRYIMVSKRAHVVGTMVRCRYHAPTIWLSKVIDRPMVSDDCYVCFTGLME